MTPDEWNAKHRRLPVDTRELAPVTCPSCGSAMFFPEMDHCDPNRLVRCVARQACVQTTIANPAYITK